MKEQKRLEMIDENTIRKLDNAIEIKSSEEINLLEQSGRLKKVYSTNPYDKRHGYSLPIIYFYRDIFTGSFYKFYPQPPKTAYTKLGAKKVNLEQLTNSLVLNFSNLFNAIMGNCEEREINRNVTKTLYPQEQLEKFLRKTIKTQEELDCLMRIYILNAIDKTLQSFPTKAKVQLITTSLSTTKMESNIILKNCLQEYLEGIATEDQADI